MNRLAQSPIARRRRWRLRVTPVLGVLLLVSLGAAPALGAGAENPSRIIFDPAAEPSWMDEIHGAGAVVDSANDVAIASSGATYVVGSVGSGMSSGASLMKYVNGVASWAAPRIYTGPYGSSEFTCVATGPGNTIYTAGMTRGSNMLTDIVVAKWSSAGVKLWDKRYDGPSHSADECTAVAVDTSGNVTAAGITFDGTSEDGAVVSWSSSGTRRWTQRLDAPSGQAIAPLGLAITSDNNVYVTGSSMDGTGLAAMTLRFSASGELKWKKTYRGPSSFGAQSRAVVACPAGGVYVCGTAVSTATHGDGLVMSYTKGGARDVLAVDTGGGGATDQSFADLAVTSTNQVVAVGSDTTAGTSDCRVVVYTVDGTIAGGVTAPGAWHDYFVAVATDPFGGYYATGTYHTAVDKTALIVARGSVLAGGGGFLSLWAPPAVSLANEAKAIAVRGVTAVVVGRQWVGPAQGADQVVLGYVY